MMLSIRMSDDLIEAVDAYVEVLQEDIPGVQWNRSSAVRYLIHETLCEKRKEGEERCSSAKNAKR